jgi:hypothetical protein
LPAIAFYISGHGFGHATRDIELINVLTARRPGVRILVRTSVAKWLFDLTIEAGRHRAPVEYHSVVPDTGIVQIDSLHLDADRTLTRARDFMATFADRVREEAEFLAAQDASLVIADIPPLGIAAAHHAGLPSIELGNFTWDWIYSAYPGADDLVEAIARAYSTATAALRLPMHGGFAAFPRVVDLPFIARRSSRDAADTRRAFGLPLDARLVLVSFGGYGLGGLDLDALSRLDGYLALVSGSVPLGNLPAGLQGGRRGSVIPIDEQKMYADGFRYEDLVKAVDVVVTKPGYGIISECVANETALLYTSRGHFIEYDVLVQEMPRFVRSRFIDHDDLFAGRWSTHLDALLSQPTPPQHVAIEGASHAAEHILQQLGTQ